MSSLNEIEGKAISTSETDFYYVNVAQRLLIILELIEEKVAVLIIGSTKKPPTHTST